MRLATWSLMLCASMHAGSAAAAQCSVAAVTMNFGTYLGTQVNVAQTIRITCSATLTLPEQVRYEVRLSPGLGNSYAQRRMQRTTAPLDSLPYNLYLGGVPAVLNTNVWGDGTGSTVVWQGNMTLATGQTTRTNTNTIAGAVPAGTVPSAGSYTDSVTATIVIR